MKRRDFIKRSSALASIAFIPSSAWALLREDKLRTAHIGVGGMGSADLDAISSHQSVVVTALCDVDSQNLANASALHPDAKVFSDYRKLFDAMGRDIDAVIVSTPDHTHAPASMMAMDMGKAVYCQKPLTHHVMEARAMDERAREKNLVTQMGIQVHSFYDYKLATILIQSGLIGKVNTVRAWSPKNWGYDGPPPMGSDPVPETLDWNLWQGTAPERPYKSGYYHPGNWRKIMDYGCGTLGDMGVHIFDTPYNALKLDVPNTIMNNCRPPTGYGFPEINMVTYEFPGTQYTTDTLKWVWYDGPAAPSMHTDFELPNWERLPDQGAMFMGEKGKLLLPHYQQLPRLIVDNEYINIDDQIRDAGLGEPVRDYATESPKHYHQFVNACLEQGATSAPFSYAARLSEVILLGVVAGRFPDKTLHWDTQSARFAEGEANRFLDGAYRKF